MDLRQFSPFKALHHWDKLVEIAQGKITTPVSCEIDPSNKCNHDCIHCFVYGYKYDESAVLDFETGKKILKDLADFGVPAVAFTGGGEPLTNPHTVELIHEGFHTYKLQTALVTNGGLLIDKHLPTLNTCCSYVRFSVDAATDRTYELLHRPKGGETLEHLLDKIRILVKLRADEGKGPTIGLAFLVHPYNYKEVLGFIKLGRRVGVDYVHIRPVFLQGMKLAGHIFDEALKQVEDGLRLQTEHYKVFPTLHRFDEVTNRIDRCETCMGHNLVVVVGANGLVYLCCQTRGVSDKVLGDVHKSTIKEIWYSEQRKRVVEDIDVTLCPPCRYIPYNKILDHISKGCPHVNFM